MSKLLDLIRTEYTTEYTFEMRKNYSDPKIYHGGKNYDLEKRWYVYFYYRHPDTKKLVIQSPVYANINRDYKTKRDRLKHLKLLRDTIKRLLKNGFSPYHDNKLEDPTYTAKSALNFVLELKKSTIGTSTYNGYKTRVNKFLKYLKRKLLDTADIKQIDKGVVTEFLNETLKSSSPINRNNYRQDLSAIFSVLAQNNYIEHNFIESIPKVTAKPVRNKTYSEDAVQELYEYMQQHDPLLLLFVKFISYNFLRPVEVCRLKIEDINLKNKTLTVKAKNKVLKTKIIPDLLIDDIVNISLTQKTDWLFTPNGPGEWKVSEASRRSWFGNRFLKVKKVFKLSEEYTMYSFRHTFITKLYRGLRETSTITDTVDTLMLITGHSSKDALYKYLRDIDAELPEDYSDLLK